MAVYLIQAGESGPVKIGVANDIPARIRELQTGHWADLHLLRQWPGDFAVEALLHKHFAHLRIAREWFRFDAVMLTIQPGDIAKQDACGMDLIRSQRGLTAKIAKGLGIFGSAVSMWKQVPAERLPAIEQITGIPRHLLRPDICPPPGDAP